MLSTIKNFQMEQVVLLSKAEPGWIPQSSEMQILMQ